MALGFDEPIRGVNLGNWLVLERWMTPGLFRASGEADEIWMHRTMSSDALDRLLRRHRETYVTLDELYRRSDVISLHCPLTEQTRYMINADSIARMKPGVVLLNTGRGQLIHTEALIEGLKQRRIGAAGLDVYEEEAAYFYEDTSDRIMSDDVLARLLSFNNVLVTSHQGFFTREALDNIARTTLDNIRTFASGAPLVNEVRFEA